MKAEHRQLIVDALLNFTENDICKIYDREYFYYNKQQLTLTEVDDWNKYIEEPINLTKLESIRLADETITELEGLEADTASDLLGKLKAFDYNEHTIEIVADARHTAIMQRTTASYRKMQMDIIVWAMVSSPSVLVLPRS